MQIVRLFFFCCLFLFEYANKWIYALIYALLIW